ncbi:MAG: LacI family DNA-binding transcriptional regulator [Chloroflexi bacterium]|nr:LacI family DNA-binding transcriptional regulator [Chloroflexota bacterium]
MEEVKHVDTLEEIARLAQVSRSTVSRVINENPNVSTATRQRVLAVVKELNYHPNAAARGLAAGRTRVLGLVIPMGVTALFTDPYFPLLIQGVSSACNEHDHSVMLWIAEPEYERRTIRQVLHNGLIDGVIVASQVMNDPVVDALLKSKLPFVLIGRHPSESAVNYTDVDNQNSAREAVAHLLRLGRRRIATITGPKNMIAGADRLEGYLAGLRAKGIAPDSDLIVEGDFTEEGGHAAMQQLLSSDLDALFAASDAMAAGALRALREAGRRVPQDVAVMGFDDMPFAARTDPPLTTVRQPIQRAGVVAAETLIDLIANPGSPPRRIILPTELVIRDSCGAGIANSKRPND